MQFVFNRVEKKYLINEKIFIDEIRCRNGNLTVSLGREQINFAEL